MMQELHYLLAGSPKLLSLEACIEEVFDTGKILNSLFMIFVVIECVLENNFKTIHKEKDWTKNTLFK
jgi:hypothetical protein